MSGSAKTLVLFVVIFHVMAFVLEAILWMHPGVHEFALARLSENATLDLHEQAAVLRSFFVNQGFYNLFLALAGISGLALLRRDDARVGYILIGYMCLSATAAGLVLALSTRAYVAAFLQAVPAAVALAMMLRLRSVERRAHP